jgi:hypothetical protein
MDADLGRQWQEMAAQALRYAALKRGNPILRFENRYRRN